MDSPDKVSRDNIKPKLEQGEDGLLDGGRGGGEGLVAGGEEGKLDSLEHPIC